MQEYFLLLDYNEILFQKYHQVGDYICENYNEKIYEVYKDRSNLISNDFTCGGPCKEEVEEIICESDGEDESYKSMEQYEQIFTSEVAKEFAVNITQYE